MRELVLLLFKVNVLYEAFTLIEVALFWLLIDDRELAYLLSYQGDLFNR